MPYLLVLLSLIFSLLFSPFSYGGFFDKQNKANYLPHFLKAEQAFSFKASEQNNQLQLHWNIAEGYYLYKKEIQIVSADNSQGKAINVNLPQGQKHADEFFGEVEIYQNQLNIEIPQQNLANHHAIEVIYQGCTAGFCYPPESQYIELTENFKQGATTPHTLLSEQDALNQALNNNKQAIFWFFLLGLGLAFTPCVLPMLPLLSAIVIGSNQRPSTLRALSLSAVYVQGMALTYTLLGLIVASIGLPFQIALQHPYVLIGLSLIFTALALSMFDLFEFRLPYKLQNKLNQYSQQQKAGAFGGVFVMGVISGLVASPCVTAPLSAALLYVAQSGNLLTGALSLYFLALGMGVPLLLITVFGNRILPKSGNWLIKIKQLCGFVMMLLPVILLARVFPEYEIYFKRIWLASVMVWGLYTLGKHWIGWCIIVSTMILWFIYPQQIQQYISTYFISKNIQSSQSSSFKSITSYEELQQALIENPKAIAMLDLYADWCVACKEFEKYTFTDSKVRQQFEHILLLQVDMTKNSENNRTLMEKLQILGLPTLIFFDQQGNEIVGSRITGFMQGEPFAQWLRELSRTTQSNP